MNADRVIDWNWLLYHFHALTRDLVGWVER